MTGGFTRTTGVPWEVDTILPSQFFERLRGGAVAGERVLMGAVLTDAVEDFQKYAHAQDPSGRALHRQAADWIAATDESWPFSFVNLCVALDLDPDHVREGLARWKASGQAYRTEPLDAPTLGGAVPSEAHGNLRRHLADIPVLPPQAPGSPWTPDRLRSLRVRLVSSQRELDARLGVRVVKYWEMAQFPVARRCWPALDALEREALGMEATA